MTAIPLTATAAKRRIGDILLAHGFVTEEQIADATAEQERTQQPLGQILVGQGAITRLELASALAEQWSDPAASISSTPRSAPAPVLVPAPSPQDEAQYAARLQEAVADLARKVQSDTPFEGVDERVEDLSRRIESTLARTQHIEAAVATLAESLEGVTTGVEEAFHALQTGTANLAKDMARIEQSVSELAARELAEGDGASLADLVDERVESIMGRLEALDHATDIDQLRRSVSDLQAASHSTTDVAERLDRVEAASGDEHLRAALDDQGALLGNLRTIVEELLERPVEPPELDGRLTQIESQLDAAATSRDELAGRVDALGERVADEPDADPRLEGVVAQLATLESRLDANVAEVDDVRARVVDQDDPAGRRRLDDLTEEVEALRQEWAMNERPALEPDEQIAELAAPRLAEIEARIEGLANDRADDAALANRLDELESARHSDLDTVDVLARAMDRIRHDLTTVPPSTGSESSEVVDAVGELAQRMTALEESRVVEPAGGRDPSELASEIERFRLVLERIDVHLGEHDLALADLTPPNVDERLQELTALVQELAASQEAVGAPRPSTAAPSLPADIGALLQRVEDAESASQSDAEKLMNRLERMASSIDWRLQRLESDETDDAE